MSKVKKHKLSRREGVDLFGTGGESLARRLGQPPGMHVRKTGRRPSEYAIRLREKQKVKRTYGMREKQFLDFFRRAQKTPGQTGAALLKLLELRLDNVVYRLSFARTRLQARQLVSHGHVLVNGRTVDIPSFMVEPGQAITLDAKAPKMPGVAELVENPAQVPAWLERQGMAGRVLREPDRSEVDHDINEQLIVEFYSR
jgi:small subunit ribosomal protein S4